VEACSGSLGLPFGSGFAGLGIPQAVSQLFLAQDQVLCDLLKIISHLGGTLVPGIANLFYNRIIEGRPGSEFFRGTELWEFMALIFAELSELAERVGICDVLAVSSKEIIHFPNAR
jgi:hypothetical protein